MKPLSGLPPNQPTANPGRVRIRGCGACALAFLFVALATSGCAAKGKARVRRTEVEMQRLASHLNGLQPYALAAGGITNDEIHVIKRLSQTESAHIVSWLSNDVRGAQDEPTFAGFRLILFTNTRGLAKVVKVNRGNGSFWIYTPELHGTKMRLGELVERLDTIHSPNLQRWLTRDEPPPKTLKTGEAPGGAIDALMRKL